MFGAPSVIMCRWEHRVEEFTDGRGQTATSRSVIWVASEKVLRDNDIVIGGFLYPDESTAASPLALPGAFEIRQIVITPDLWSADQEVRILL